MTMIIPSRYNFTGTSKGGGMGDIHECTDTHLNRPVVVKMLKNATESRRLLDEQKALIKVRSKHVVQLYDVIKVQEGSSSKTALVLEHIDGKDLKVDSLKSGKDYLNTLWQIACGLVEIHRVGIIHRDIKPNNIRVDASGVVKILDFGLARNTGLEAKTMSVIGTPGFMAPELWKDATISFNQAIDVYAFGITALALIDTSRIPGELSGRPPEPLIPGVLAKAFPDLSYDIITVIEECLSYNPNKRPRMEVVEAIIRKHLLCNRHRALLVLEGKTHELNAATPTVNLKTNVGAIGITYNGLTFNISSLSGSVFVNNTVTAVGDELPVCCVLTFGPKERARTFVTFDVSNPEVMP